MENITLKSQAFYLFCPTLPSLSFLVPPFSVSGRLGLRLRLSCALSPFFFKIFNFSLLLLFLFPYFLTTIKVPIVV
ncbi:hypothetical protein GQ457_04G008780 [Hibiscus cannabinus]